MFLNVLGSPFYTMGRNFFSQNGLLDLINRNTNSEELRYAPIHLKGEDIEVALTHGNEYGEEYYAFVNGQYTTQGGPISQPFREGIVKTVREFYKKDFDAADIRQAVVGAIAIRIQEPVSNRRPKRSWAL
ncbi:MAG: hypothetical protein R2794_12345 [Chitinophagales bacterium]